jgi:hypothetical protein
VGKREKLEQFGVDWKLVLSNRKHCRRMQAVGKRFTVAKGNLRRKNVIRRSEAKEKMLHFLSLHLFLQPRSRSSHNLRKKNQQKPINNCNIIHYNHIDYKLCNKLRHRLGTVERGDRKMQSQKLVNQNHKARNESLYNLP